MLNGHRASSSEGWPAAGRMIWLTWPDPRLRAAPAASSRGTGMSAAVSAMSAHTCAAALNGPSPRVVGVVAVAAMTPAVSMAATAMADSMIVRHRPASASTGTAITIGPPTAKMTAAIGTRLSHCLTDSE